ncbi:mediator of RNA polymerase II transcription subunit 29-like [Euwallacea fornicatus]|uniref:mediator of RNA polymerase II transcription subunit 29-like n=1 Tax=Euwallacea fornicatus TaxID=995702 RepID=UPI00338E4BD0
MYSLADKNIPFNISKQQQQEMQQQQVVQQQQLQQAQQMQQQQSQQQSPQALDNISKIKSLIGPLRDSLALTIKTAAQTLSQNSQIDSGSQKAPDIQLPRFDKNLEEFYSICDQIELHLKTSVKCLSQAESSNRYLNVPVIPMRSEPMGMNENSLTYPQFLATVGAQVTYTKEIHETLLAAAQNISPSE